MCNARILLLGLPVLAASLPARAIEGEDLLKAVDRNLNPQSYEMYRKLINIGARFLILCVACEATLPYT